MGEARRPEAAQPPGAAARAVTAEWAKPGAPRLRSRQAQQHER
jgi:hypothetical protein